MDVRTYIVTIIDMETAEEGTRPFGTVMDISNCTKGIKSASVFDDTALNLSIALEDSIYRKEKLND